MKTTIVTTQDNDNLKWQSFYINSLTSQIDRLISRVKKNKKVPNSLVNHFDSMRALFEQGRVHPDLNTRLKSLHFVHALHPLPIWWGKWSEWMRILDMATIIAEEVHEIKYQIWSYIAQSEMLLSGRDAKEALTLAKKALVLAQAHLDTEMIFRAEMAVFEAEKDIGYIGDRIDALRKLEKSLLAKEKILPEKISAELKIEFLLKKTDVLRRLGRKKDVVLSIQEAYRLAINTLDEDSLLAQVYNRRGAAYWSAEKNDLAIADFEKATEIYGIWGDQASQVYSRGYIGLINWSAGEYRDAEKMLQSSISMAEEIKALQWQTIQVGNLGLVNFNRGRLPQAVALMKQHYMLSQLINNRAEIERANGNIGYIQIYTGDFKNAYQRINREILYAEKMKFHIGVGTSYANMAWVMDGLGDIDSALGYAEKSLFMAKKTDAPLLKIVALRSMSELQKDLSVKAHYAEEARIMAKKRSRRFNEAGALFTLADCYQDKKLQDEAIQLLDKLGSTDWINVPLAFKSLRLPLLYWG